MTLNPGFVLNGLGGITNQLVVAELSPVHQNRADLVPNNGGYDASGFAGNRSGISFNEVYHLVCGFFYEAL